MVSDKPINELRELGLLHIDVRRDDLNLRQARRDERCQLRNHQLASGIVGAVGADDKGVAHSATASR
ncbi:hypothetical protein GCM10027579_10410 [Calidifontibacter terrae]